MGLFCKPPRRRITPLLYSWSRQRRSPGPDRRDLNVDAAAAAARVSYRRSSSLSPPAGTFDGAGSVSSFRSHTRPPRRRREQKLYATSGVDDCCNGCDECSLPERGGDQEAELACCDGCCSPSFSSSAPCCCCCYSGRRIDCCPDCEQTPSYGNGRLGSRLDRFCGAGVGCSVDACAYETGLDGAGGCDCPAR
ncbi:uncharacterized protein BDW47DRAFT_115995 [Aspergillus candidus]|uniref:Uncharacterized protein n=1 Tax=Aspergillus candidus TaxID=41067 RepID=A0A2I2FHT4_ASPCN|nr:hypothetical protein BDW47DRAFT_115995 [Aspergillus candidus]PLB40169.1 hypothetical protein BDW47DRAFT_115995 [Aspergillus candidus]